MHARAKGPCYKNKTKRFTVTIDAHSDDHAEHAPAAGFLKTYLFSLDHKIIGLQFLFSTLIWFFVGGMLAMGIRWQLAYAHFGQLGWHG